MNIDTGEIKLLTDLEVNLLKDLSRNNRSLEERLALLSKEEYDTLKVLTPAERIAHPIRERLKAHLEREIQKLSERKDHDREETQGGGGDRPE